ncbi:response regulator [Methylomagnum sp.]
MAGEIEIFPWNENFETGIPEIDAQHRRLIDLLNLLVSHLAFQSDVPALNIIFDELKAYTVAHFEMEQDIWHRYFESDAWEIWHQRAHTNFIDEVVRLKSQEAVKPLDDVIEGIVSFLTRWLAMHILESDKRMAKVALALPSGMSLEQAKEMANNEMSGATKVLIDTVMKMYESLANRTILLTREMNKRRLAEQELRQAHLVYQNSSEAIVVVDADNRIQAVNPAFTEVTGYGPDDALGGDLNLLDSGRHDPTFHRAIWNAVETLGKWQGELWSRRKDGGEYAELRTINTIFGEAGKVHRRVVLFLDITERKRRDEELERARQTADAANRAKSEFLANMSHEIRTPMNAIIGLTHLLRREISEPPHADKLEKIADSAEHLLSIINDILDISKIEAGKLVLEEAEFDLEGLLATVSSLVADKAESRGVELVTDIEPALAATFRGDALRLRQILLNLVGNAVKFTVQGSVVLRAHRLEATAAGELIRFEVKDTGIGIAPEHHSRLFKAFEQADGSSARVHGGTGLGLAISRRLVELMGGEIGVDSRLGEGSTFWFNVRLAKGGGTRRRRQEPGLTGCRALVVDDLAETRAVLNALLLDLGLRVDSTGSGEGALAAIQAADRAGEPYALVLLDWRMPGLDGLETAARLRQLPLRNPPTRLLMTAFGQALSVDEAQRAGFDALLTKPVTPGALLDALLALSHRSAGRRAEPSGSAPLAPEERLSRHYRNARLLLAEDNPVNREVALKLLQSVGLDADVAEDGMEAVARARVTDYDLILMDMQMPVLDGIGATRAIRALPDRADTPILAMTANAFDEDRQRCLDAGMSDHIGKPVRPEALYASLLQWLPERPARGDSSPAADPSQSIRARLATLSGLNIEIGLDNVGSGWETYLMVLRLYVQTHGGDPAILGRHLAGGNLGEVLRLAHSLKGSSVTVGATLVETRALALETALRQDRPAAEDIRRALDALVPALRDLLAGLRAALSEPAAAGPEDDLAQAREALARLEALLTIDDLTASAVYREAAGVLRGVLGEAAERLDRQIDAFDYAEALLTVRGCLARLAESSPPPG